METMTERRPWWAGDATQFEKAAQNGETNWTKAMRQAGLNYKVRIVPVVGVLDEDGSVTEPVDGCFALVDNNGHAYGIVGQRFKATQNVDLGKVWATEIARQAKGKIVSVWSRPGLAAINIQLGGVVGSSLESLRGEMFEVHVSLVNRHGSGTLEAHVFLHRPDGHITLPVKTFYLRPQVNPANEVTAFVARMQQGLGLYIEQAAELADTKANAGTLDRVISEVWQKPGEDKAKALAQWRNRREAIINTWQESPHIEAVRLTSWGVYLAINEYMQYGRTFRGSGGDPETNEYMRPEELLYGFANEIAESALAALSVPRRGRRAA